MKRLYTFISFAALSALVASCSLADGKGLDVDEFGTKGSSAKMPGNGVYMNLPGGNVASSLLLDDEVGGKAVVMPVLASPFAEDMTVTLSFDPTVLDEYNKANGLKLLPVEPSLVTFYADGSETGSEGNVDVVIPAGKTSALVNLDIKPLNPEKYSFSSKYAVPVRITKNSANIPVLSSPNYAIVTLNRSFKTDVLHIIKMGGSAKISMNEPMKKDLTEWTMQGQFHFSQLQRNDPQVASPNQTLMNIGGGGITMGWWTRIAYGAGIQIKRGRDGADMWTQAPLKDHEWINVTFVYREVSKVDNTGRIEVYYGDKLVKTFDEKTTPSYTWKAGAPDPSWSFGFGNYRDDYIREIKLWNRALTSAEIQDKLYLPEDPKAEGLLFYYPLTKKSYDEEARTFIDLTGNSKLTLPDRFDFEFVENVVLPNKTIVVE